MPSSLCDGDLICFNRVCTAKKVILISNNMFDRILISLPHKSRYQHHRPLLQRVLKAQKTVLVLQLLKETKQYAIVIVHFYFYFLKF